MRVSITQLNTRVSGDTMILNMGVGCKNIEHYDSIVARLKTIKGVVSVTRGFN